MVIDRLIDFVRGCEEGETEKGCGDCRGSREVADHLGLHHSTVSRLINEGNLKIPKLLRSP